MKIKKITSNIFPMIKSEFESTKADLKEGWCIGGAFASRKKLSKPADIYVRTKSVIRKLNESNNIIPAFFAGAFAFIPVLGAMPLGLALGLGVKKVLNNSNIKNMPRKIVRYTKRFVG